MKSSRKASASLGRFSASRLGVVLPRLMVMRWMGNRKLASKSA